MSLSTALSCDRGNYDPGFFRELDSEYLKNMNTIMMSVLDDLLSDSSIAVTEEARHEADMNLEKAKCLVDLLRDELRERGESYLTLVD